MVNRSLRAYLWHRAATQGRNLEPFPAYSPAPLGHKAQAACQFTARGFMKGAADGECSGCVPSGPRHVRRDVSHGATMERETAGERGFRSIPALSRASDADEELAPPTPLKEQGNRSLRCGTSAGGVCRRGRVAECRRLGSIAAAQRRRPLRFEVYVRGPTGSIGSAPQR